jgi:hypothetical protein
LVVVRRVALGFAATGFVAGTLVVAVAADGFEAAALFVAAFDARAVAGFEAAAAVAGPAAAADGLAAARDRAVGVRLVAGLALDAARGVTVVLTGETAPAAWIAAEPTPLAAPVTASPTLAAAEPAAAAAIPPSFAASDATSFAASAACFVRLATSFLPLDPCTVASWCSRFVSVLRAATRAFSSFRNSLAALLESGVTTPAASTITCATESMTVPAGPLSDRLPSPRLAIDRPPYSGAPRAPSLPHR